MNVTKCNTVLMEKATKKEFWENVRSNEEYCEILQIIIKTYQKTRWKNIPVLKFAPRMRFYTDGDRAEFEKDYFRRRRFLASAALLSLIYPEDETYIKDVEEIIWAICEEYTWVLPAHCNGNNTDTTIIDLFNAETAFSLAEIHYFLKDRLNPLISLRVKNELQRRIVDNYDNNVYPWERIDNGNWAAVCAGNVGGVFMYSFPEKMEEHKQRLVSTMKFFIKGFSTDGTCLEGPGYWHYGFGNFVWFADLLYQYTKGEIDLFEIENVKNIAGYMQRSFLKGKTIVSFSDSSPNTKADNGLQTFLRKRFPDDVLVLNPENCMYSLGNVMWRDIFRNIYYLEDIKGFGKNTTEDYYLPDAGQAIINRNKYSLAAKAGHNAEPHNHNDIGSFILSTEKGQVLCDLGAGRYTRQYFKAETRYNYFCNSSAGHNLPIINENYQKEGKNYKGTLSCNDGFVEVDFKSAYDIIELKRMVRTFSCLENKVVMTDSFDIDYETFTERFISYFKPEISDKEVKIADIIIKYDSKKCKAVINEACFEPHNARLPNKTVYCIDFILNKGLNDISFEFIV